MTKPTCMDCGGPVSRKETKRCRNCLGPYFKLHPPSKGSLPGKDSIAWKGGRTKTKFGYIYVKSPEHPFKSARGYVFEHRLVMEKSLGRYLTKDEIVHHINNDKSDNRLENLLLMTQAEHLRIHKPETFQNNKRDPKTGRFLKN